MQFISAIRLPVVLAIVVVSASQSAMADPIKEKAARRFIEAHAKLIMRAAHPTVVYVNAEFDGSSNHASGFNVVYTLNWKKKGNKEKRHYTTFNFMFDTNGKLQSLEPTGRSNILPPFALSDVALELIKEAIKSDPDLAKNRKMQAILDRAKDAKTLLVEYMKLKQ